MKRRCPNCGAVVPENSLTCPQCYAEVERELPDDGHRDTRQEFREHIRKRNKNMTVSLILAIIPAFFGLLGLGLAYQDYRNPRWMKYLGTGLVLFLLPVLIILFLWVLSILLIIPILFLLLLYIGTALVSIAETYFGSFDNFVRRKDW